MKESPQLFQATPKGVTEEQDSEVIRHDSVKRCILIECRETKTTVITTAIMNPLELKAKKGGKTQVTKSRLVFSHAFDWSGGWRDGPSLVDQSDSKLNQSKY